MNDKLTLKSVYKEYWKCRDFELQHFWQRSIFLTAFLVGCFTLYGGLLASVLENLEKLYALFVVLNCGGFMISFVGIVLSCLWIMMAKGSKAWYERWEKAIYAFPDAYSGAFEAGAEKVAGFRIEEIDGFQNDKVSSWLWNTHGGAYSPSKINIAIGHLSLIIWCSTAFLHMSSLYCGRELVVRMIDGLDSSFCGMVLALLWSIGLLLVWIYARSNLKSGVLQDN